MEKRFQVESLVQVLSEYCLMPIESVTLIFEQSVVTEETGHKAIELTIVEEKLGLPPGFFAKAVGIEQAPVAVTTEACTESKR